MNLRYAGLMLIASALFVGGCSDRDLRPLNPCTVTGVVIKVTASGSNDVDMLMMIDNSGSMAEEQAALALQIPRMVEVLVTGQTATETFDPVDSLRVGVITSDMGLLGVGIVPATGAGGGTSGNQQTACGFRSADNTVDPEDAFFGDDGRIQLVSGAAADAGCPASFPSFLQFAQGQDSAAFVENVSCTAALGIGGCAFEMQLESILVAVTDSSQASAPEFVPNTSTGAPRDRVGQATAGEANADFFRPGALKAIVVVSDEEDCSTANPELFMFQPGESTLNPPDIRVNTRCLFYKDHLYDIQRYVDGILALEPNPNRIIFASIIGLPLDLEGESPETILADPRMDYTDIRDGGGTLIDNAAPVFTEPACIRCTNAAGETVTVADWRECADVDLTATPEFDESLSASKLEALQWAAPGRRFVDLSGQLAAQGVGIVNNSICAEDFSPAMDAILATIIERLTGACLPRQLNADESGRVNCDVVEILPLGSTCAQRAAAVGGRDAERVRVEDDREVCRVTQLVPTSAERGAGQDPSGEGWFYDDYTTTNTADCPGAQRIGFVGPDPVGDVRLECIQPVQGGGLAGPDIFEGCTDDSVCAWSDVAIADEFIVRYNLERGRFISGSTVSNQGLFCSSGSRSCQIGCSDSSQCPGGFVCFDPDSGDGSGTTDCSDNSGGNGCFCINPTCSLESSGGEGDVSTPDGGV